MRCLVAVTQEQLVHAGGMQYREDGVQRHEAGHGTRRSCGKNAVKSSVRTSRKRPPLSLPLAINYKIRETNFFEIFSNLVRF